MKIKKIIFDLFIKKELFASISIIIGYILKVILIIIIPLITKHILDVVIPDKNYNLLFKWASIALFVALGLIIVGLINTYLANRLKYKFGNYLQSALLKSILFSKWHKLAKHGSGYLTKRIEGDIEGVNTLLINNVLDLTKNIVTFIVSLIIVSRFNLKLSLAFFTVLPIYAFSLKAFNKGMKEKTVRLQESLANNSSFLNETISGRLEIKYLSIENMTINRYLNKLHNIYKIAIDRFFYSCKPATLGQISSTLGKIILIWYGGYLLIKGEFTIGAFFAFNMIMANVFLSVSGLVNLNISLQTGLSCIRRIEEILSVSPEDSGGIDIEEIDQISFKNVNFHYPDDSSDYSLSNISFNIKKGEIITLVGRSGSGKSTIFKILLRLYKPDSGVTIINNDINLNDISLRSYRNRISIVQQETFLFNMSIRDNILTGNPKATEIEISELVENLNIKGIISNLDEGIDHMIIERGFNLSGGQKQRIAIARALIKRTDILLLDEVTTGLDNNNIKLLHNLLLAKKSTMATILIAHSRDAMLLADKIILIENGRINAIDSHSNLIESNILYQNLFNEIDINENV